MRRVKLVVLPITLFIICLFNSILLFAQKYSDLSSKYFQEPYYTVGTNNAVIVKQRPIGYIFHYIIGQDDSVGFFYQGGNDTGWAFYYPPDSKNPLKHGKKFNYYFEILDSDSNVILISEPDSSIQDSRTPKIGYCQFVCEINDYWVNKSIFNIKYSIRDSAGIDSVFLYERIFNEDYWLKIDSIGYYNVTDSGAAPNDTIVFDSFTVIVSEDNHYEYYIGSKDAAHDSISCAKKWILNGNKDVPVSLSEPHLWIKIDTHEPYSTIKILDAYYNRRDFEIPYLAFDSLAGSNNIASGLDSISLYYILNNKTNFDTLHVFNSTTDSIDRAFDFSAPSEGRYTFYVRAIDHAMNKQSIINTNMKHTIVDTTKPKINKFSLKDPTDAADFYTVADTGWTKVENILADIDTISDNLSDLDSIFFIGDIKSDFIRRPFKKEPIYLELTNDEGLKEVRCWIADKAKNVGDTTEFEIILDKTPPQLDKLILLDFDSPNSDSTNTLLVRVIPIVADSTDTTISQIALYENSPLPFTVRETLWQPFSPGDTLKFLLEKGPAPRMRSLYAVIRDHAGNISNEVKGSINYVPKLSIGGLTLQDLDGEVKNSKGERFTNNLIVNVKISGLLRFPDDTTKAYFEFCRDSSFSDSVVKVRYDSSIYIDYSMRTAQINLKKLGHNNNNDIKIVYIRLIDSSLIDTSNTVCDTIILDTMPPIFGTPGLVLQDITKENDPNYLTFKADPGWTDELEIEAHILDCNDNLSGCDSLRFWKDVKETKVPFKNIIPLTLLWETTRAETAYVSARDSVGNWGNVIKATILYDRNPPLIKIQSPKEDESILLRDALIVEVYVKDLPDLKNMSKIWFCEEGRGYDFIELHNLDTNNLKISVPISSGEGKKTICMVAVDKAGNPSDLEKCNINFISQVDTFHERVRNVPNPFNASRYGITKIIITSKQEGARVDVKIYDVFGNLVKSWLDERIQHKLCEIEWNGENGEGIPVGEGAYICIAKIGSKITKKTKIGVLRR